jgi:hypothetical protein
MIKILRGQPTSDARSVALTEPTWLEENFLVNGGGRVEAGGSKKKRNQRNCLILLQQNFEREPQWNLADPDAPLPLVLSGSTLVPSSGSGVPNAD